MTFNPNSDISGSKVRRSGGKTGLAVGGLGGLGVIAVFLIAQFTGVDLSGFLGGSVAPSTSQSQGTLLEECKTGADANANVDCRMGGAEVSLEDYWVQTYPSLGASTAYHRPEFTLFSNAVSTGCGNASSATGPFYCPGDETIYIDTTFFDQLRSQFGASGGPLSELYIVAHEWGHHVQNLEGTFATSDRNVSGPTSDTVRIELQADCYAGAWVAAASSTTDSAGNALLQKPTQAQIDDALNAAATVGDDRIQQQSGGQVNPEAWTHGSSEQRQRWFTNGFEGGVGACDTFATNSL